MEELEVYPTYSKVMYTVELNYVMFLLEVIDL